MHAGILYLRPSGYTYVHVIELTQTCHGKTSDNNVLNKELKHIECQLQCRIASNYLDVSQLCAPWFW